ncbi:MAG TPA: hypothetical protein ENJ56_02615 [Anaerolineae bacterium]|nr:hypothetical protein [Anaerolineae bacterium]
MSKPAPKFQLAATSTERIVGVPYSQPKVLVLLFQDENTAEVAREVNQTIRAVHEDVEDLIVATLVDMSGVPRFMRKMGQKMLLKAYQDAAEKIELADGVDPADFIVLLPDWSGDTFRIFQVGDVSRKALMVIIDHEGNIVFRRQGGNLGKAALAQLDKLI